MTCVNAVSAAWPPSYDNPACRTCACAGKPGPLPAVVAYSGPRTPREAVRERAGIAVSSNGRTADLGSVSEGSTPSTAATEEWSELTDKAQQMLDTLVDLALDTPEEEDGWERESFHILFIEDAADLGMQPWEPVDIDAALEELRSRGLAAPFPETDAWAAAGKGQRLVLAVRNLPL